LDLRADWLDKAPNHLIEFSPGDERFLDCLKVIKVEDIRSGSFIRVIMNDEIGQALAFLTDEDEYLIK